MNVDLDDMIVSNNEPEQRYEVQVNGRLAVLDYQRTGNRLALVHTGVPKELEGQGIGGALARAALEEAHAQGLTVIPRCPFVASYIRRHPDYRDLVSPADQERYLNG